MAFRRPFGATLRLTLCRFCSVCRICVWPWKDEQCTWPFPYPPAENRTKTKKNIDSFIYWKSSLKQPLIFFFAAASVAGTFRLVESVLCLNVPRRTRRHNTHHVKIDGVVSAHYLHCDGRLVVRYGANVLPPVAHTQTHAKTGMQAKSKFSHREFVLTPKRKVLTCGA